MLKKRLFAATAAAAVIVTGISFLAFTTGRSQADNAALKSKPVAVEVATATRTDLTETVSAVGTVAAFRDVMVSSETAGRITAVPVRVGDHVREGQTLVRVDDEIKAIAVEQAAAQLQAAKTNLAKSRKDFERSEALFKTGDISDAELEAYKLGYHTSEAQYQGAAVALKLAQRQLEDTRIKSPISGVVASCALETGEMVAPGQPVANVVDISTVKVKVSIPEEEIGKITMGQPSTLRVDSRPDAQIKGSVYTVGSKAESEGGHTYPVEIIVRGQDVSMLSVGMFARVEVRARTAADAIAVPKESVIDAQTKPAVYVVQDGYARLRLVTLGIRSGDRYQVVDGLQAGDVVVSFGQSTLKDGSAVQYK